jgi:hypothetical protein
MSGGPHTAAANAGALLIEYGTTARQGLRFVEGALLVARRQAEHNHEVFCLQLMAVHDRFVGVPSRRAAPSPTL